MAKFELEDGASLELLDGEEIICASPKVARLEGFFKGTTFIFVITNKRVALVRYPKKDKEGKGTDTVNYADILYAQRGKDPDSSLSEFSIVFLEKEKKLGFIPVHKKMLFRIQAGLVESFVLTGKDIAAEMRSVGANMADSAARESAANDATSLADYEKRMDQWRAVRKQFVEGSGKNSKPTPKDRRNLLVSALNDAIKLAKQ